MLTSHLVPGGVELSIPPIRVPIVQATEPLFRAALSDFIALPFDSPERSLALRRMTTSYNRLYSAGHFHDSFGFTGVLSRLGMHWLQHVKPVLNERNELHGECLRQFRVRVAAAQLQLPTTEELKARYAQIQGEQCSVGTWHRHFRRKHRELLAFLGDAIALDTHVVCSI